MSDILSIPSSKRFKDLTGKKFHRLTVVGYLGRRCHSSAWLCKCDCGANSEVSAGALQKGSIKSCGCFQRERMAALTYKHGGRSRVTGGSSAWKAWEGMRSRCADPSNKDWKWYGGKGIKVHSSWMDDFDQFIRHIGPKPTEKHTLDRIDRNGNYEPGNVRWATWTEQARNRSNNRIVEFKGQSMVLIEAAELSGIPYKTVKMRVAKGWDTDRALTQPVDKRKSNVARRSYIRRPSCD